MDKLLRNLRLIEKSVTLDDTSFRVFCDNLGEGSWHSVGYRGSLVNIGWSYGDLHQ